MSTDALAALLRKQFDDDALLPGYEREAAQLLAAQGVVVLPPDHPLRTGEPSEAMVKAADDKYDTRIGAILDGDDGDPEPVMRSALRAALAVLRES